jgi:hypothetical protein
MVVNLGQPIFDNIEKVFRALEGQARWKTIAELLAVHIRQSADVPARTRDFWRYVGTVSLQAIEARAQIDHDELGQILKTNIDNGLAQLYLLSNWVRDAAKQGQVVENAADLQALIHDQETIRSEALDNWPWTPTKEEWDEAVAEFERGDSLPADEAFAEIAGVEKAEWLRRVEEYKRRRGGEGAAP